MFPDSKSKYGALGIWDTGRQTKILVRETKSRLGFEMRTSDWRQIQSSTGPGIYKDWNERSYRSRRG